MKKYAFISGGNSGLARASIDYLLKNDYVVFEGDITNKEIITSGDEHKLPLDVTSNESITTCYDYVKKITNKLDLIVNFAGIVILGSMVESDLDKLSRIVDINLIGTYKINNAFFPLINEAKGRIINISSEYGLLDAIPFHTYYTLTKHAIEVYNDGLRRELSKSGIKVIAIRPGAFKTNMQGGIQHQFDVLVNETKLYKKPLLKMQHIMTKELKKAKPTSVFVKTFKKAVTSKHPKFYYNVGHSFKMKLLSAMPSKVQDAIFNYYFK